MFYEILQAVARVLVDVENSEKPELYVLSIPKLNIAPPDLAPPDLAPPHNKPPFAKGGIVKGVDLAKARYYALDNERLLSWSPAISKIPNNTVILIEW